jgi:hypothetical protein
MRQDLSNHWIILLKFLYLLFCLIYFVYIECFWPADRRVESEPVENFQDIDFEDFEQQQAGFEGKCPDAFCTYFLVSIYRFACW